LPGVTVEIVTIEGAQPLPAGFSVERRSRKGKLTGFVKDTIVVADIGVTGITEKLDLNWFASARQGVWDRSSLEHPAEEGNRFVAGIQGLLLAAPKFVGRRIGYDYRVEETQLILAALNGDISVEPTCDTTNADGVIVPAKHISAGVVTVSRSAYVRPDCRARNKVRARVPILAGDVASELKIRHGILPLSEENRKLIRADAGRKIGALRKGSDVQWTGMRSRDAYLVTMHAAEMYWIMSSDEEDVLDIYERKHLTALRETRASKAKVSLRC
jgi:hypothetical protein